jgi:FKBP-type peptidyl-prolyl cis-trans isomerase FkpA
MAAMKYWKHSLLAAMLMVTACDDQGPDVDDVAALEIIDVTAGTGATAVAGSYITVHYTGWLYDEDAAGHRGERFDRSVGRNPLSFTLGVRQVIEGWDRGIAGMREGGRRTLIIPSRMGYGPGGNGPIPGGSALVFDVELVDVVN